MTMPLTSNASPFIVGFPACESEEAGQFIYTRSERVSYNIDHVEVISQNGFSIDQKLLEQLREEYSDECPEISILDEDWTLSEGFWWHGEFSGKSYGLLKNILGAFDGEADLIVTWEGGDSFTGLRLKDHVVTEHEVGFTLGKQKERT